MLGLVRIVGIATAAELAGASAVLGLVGLSGSILPWADAFNSFAPAGFVVAALGALLASVFAPKGGTRNIILSLATVGAVAAAILVTPELVSAVPTGQARAPAPAFKVITFNVWGKNADPQRTLDAILAADADLVLLQEADGLHRWIEPLYRVYPYRRARGAEMIFSRNPLADAPKPPPGLQAVAARVLTAQGPFTVVTAHLTWPPPFGNQDDQRRRLSAYLKGLDPETTLLSGDFNLTPWAAGMRSFESALAPLHRQTRAMFSWPALIARLDQPAPAPLLPIDHVFAGTKWRTSSIRRLPRTGSDHYGLLLRLVRAPEAPEHSRTISSH